VPIPTTQSNYQTTRWTNYQILTLEGDLPAELEEPRIQNLPRVRDERTTVSDKAQ
jgi:hypothetical protein